MGKIFFIFLSVIYLTLSLGATTFTKKATTTPVLVQKGDQKQWCCICGMDLKSYYKTSYIVKTKNDKQKQYCSLRCLAMDIVDNKLDPKTIEVVDAATQNIIDAKKAYFLVGSRINGTMSKKSKLAFASLDDIKKFKKKYRGKIVNFKEALALAKNSLDGDIAMVEKKKIKKLYPKGKRVYHKLCKQGIDVAQYNNIQQLKTDILSKKICKKMKPKQLHALALYLIDIKKGGKKETQNEDIITVTKKEKCPVCGMFTYKYPRWAAQIYYKHNNHTHHFSFDGVKDLMKFYFNPSQWGTYKDSKSENITKILVTDYYSQKAIDGRKAFYVIRSNVYGPMGHEFIPFKRLSDAKTFMIDHLGKKILQFDQITEEQTYQLDEN